MEMIDVLKKLQEIAETKPELVKDAVESVEKTNPKEVKENAVESETPVKEYEDKIQEYQVGSYKDFLKSKGVDIFKLKGDDHSKWAKEYRAAKDQGAEAEYRKSGSRDHKTYTPSTSDDPAKVEAEPEGPAELGKPKRRMGGMSDIHIGAQEVLDEYLDDAEGDLKMPKAQVLQAMKAEAEKAPFPRSYEIETAMEMVGEKFDDDGSRRHEMEPDMASAEPQTTETPVEEGPKQDQAKVMMQLESLRDMIMELPISDDAKTSVHTSLDQVSEDVTMGESTELNTTTMTTEDKKPVNESKKPVKEAITMTADTPEEAGMLMQIMKLAGVQQVTPDMIGAETPGEAPAENDADHDHDGDGVQDHAPQDCPSDDAVGSGEMGKMRDMISQNDTDEQADEQFANEPEEKVHDVEKALQSGGLGASRKQVRKEYPGDNPLAAEDKVTEQDLANSLRTQYEGFKTSYQKAANEAKAKPDFLDMDKDGNKKEPMKKAIADKK